MKNITSSAELKKAIALLETERSVKLDLLKAQFNVTVESIVPLKFLRNTLNGSQAPGFGNIITSALLGLVTSFLSTRIFKGTSAGAFKKIAAAIIETGVAGFITTHSDAIISLIESLFAKLFPKEKVEV